MYRQGCRDVVPAGPTWGSEDGEVVRRALSNVSFMRPYMTPTTVGRVMTYVDSMSHDLPPRHGEAHLMAYAEQLPTSLCEVVALEHTHAGTLLFPDGVLVRPYQEEGEWRCYRVKVLESHEWIPTLPRRMVRPGGAYIALVVGLSLFDAAEGARSLSDRPLVFRMLEGSAPRMAIAAPYVIATEVGHQNKALLAELGSVESATMAPPRAKLILDPVFFVAPWTPPRHIPLLYTNGSVTRGQCARGGHFADRVQVTPCDHPVCARCVDDMETCPECNEVIVAAHVSPPAWFRLIEELSTLPVHFDVGDAALSRALARFLGERAVPVDSAVTLKASWGGWSVTAEVRGGRWIVRRVNN